MEATRQVRGPGEVVNGLGLTIVQLCFKIWSLDTNYVFKQA
jgi:hypothetical protein